MKKDLVYDLKELKAQKFEVILPIIIGYAYVWVGNIVSSVLSTYLSGLFGMQVSEAANQEAIISAVSSDLGILMIISAVFIGPVIEELVFRKALFGLIKKDSVALFVSTLNFGLIHVVTEQSIAAALINGSSYFVMGFVFGYIYIKANRNVMIPTIVHIINNAVSILVILFIL
jgi:membrane protease YdiL (CAAX protease family)